MKGFKKFFFDGLYFTVLVETLIFIVAAIAQPSASLPIGRYFLIMLFAFIISGANWVCASLELGKLARLLAHYVILMCAFCFVLMPAIGQQINGAARAFAGIAIYTVFYFAFWGLGILAKHLLADVDTKKKVSRGGNSKSSGGSKSKKHKNEQSGYTPRYK